MLDFIQDAAQKLGIGEDTAKSATGGILGMVKEHASAADFSELTSKLPDVGKLVGAAPAADSGGGIGDMLGGLSSALGGGGGGALGALGGLAKTGLPLDKVGDFAGMFTGYLKNKVGGDLIKRLLSKVPGLSNLIG